ncbi:MAG: 4-alpha-glucanotransferase [Traorella sp.]
MRKAGVLLAISSLPSNYGIGDFGESCFQFIDDLNKAGFKCWQILPLNPLGYGNSPYQPYSSLAMDELYISLDELKKMGYIQKTKKFNAYKKKVDYQAVREFKTPYYQEAFHNFKKDEKYQIFASLPWVRNYAVFLTLKKENDMKIWHEWSEEQKTWIKNHRYDLTPLQEKIEYEIFIQYILYSQWMKVKDYAHSKDIEIIGDLPIYVGIDSVDVWANQESFLLDDDGRPIFIAGVPPDYFSATGQRWGNPLYDWDYLAKHQFDFWCQRLEYNSKLFDFVRIDHFRAFDTYWKIPVECETAIEGEWVEAPGYQLFDTLFEKIENLNIIAEDLGNLRPEVLKLRDYYHLPGMKVIQFSFNPQTPFTNETENMVVYTGTHDNQTTLSWFTSQTNAFKKQTKVFFDINGYHYDTIVDNFIYYTLSLKAKIAIIPMQDLLGLDLRSRMNTPGTVGNPNWQWKLSSFKEFEDRLPLFKEMIKKSQR